LRGGKKGRGRCWGGGRFPIIGGRSDDGVGFAIGSIGTAQRRTAENTRIACAASSHLSARSLVLSFHRPVRMDYINGSVNEGQAACIHTGSKHRAGWMSLDVHIASGWSSTTVLYLWMGGRPRIWHRRGLGGAICTYIHHCTGVFHGNVLNEDPVCSNGWIRLLARRIPREMARSRRTSQ
jgi:hypothetical protein